MRPQWVLLLLLSLSILLSGQTLTENKARISSGFFLLRKYISDHSLRKSRVSGEEKTGLGKLGVEVHACPHYTQAGGLEFKTILSYYIESSRSA